MVCQVGPSRLARGGDRGNVGEYEEGSAEHLLRGRNEWGRESRTNDGKDIRHPAEIP